MSIENLGMSCCFLGLVIFPQTVRWCWCPTAHCPACAMLPCEVKTVGTVTSMVTCSTHSCVHGGLSIYLSIPVNTHGNTCQYTWQHLTIYLSISVNTCKYMSIPVNTCQYLSIYVNTRQYLSIYLSISVNIPVNTFKYLLIPVHTCQYTCQHRTVYLSMSGIT